MKKTLLILMINHLIAFSAFTATPARPNVLPKNPRSEREIDRCLRDAGKYLKTPEAEAERRRYVPGIGARTKAVNEALGGSETMASQSRLSSEERVRRNFSEQCLAAEGYQIGSWE